MSFIPTNTASETFIFIGQRLSQKGWILRSERMSSCPLAYLEVCQSVCVCLAHKAGDKRLSGV